MLTVEHSSSSAKVIDARGRQLCIRHVARGDWRVYENVGDSLFEPHWKLAGRGGNEAEAMEAVAS